MIDQEKGVVSVRQTKKMVDASGNNSKFCEIKKESLKNLEETIKRFTSTKTDDVVNALKEIISIFGEIYCEYGGKFAYAPGAREAAHHAFSAGVFMNFRYRYNGIISLEQLMSRGCADIVILFRGSSRSFFSIPIVWEQKAATSKELKKLEKGEEIQNSRDVLGKAFQQVRGYLERPLAGIDRLPTLAREAVCCTVNFDFSNILCIVKPVPYNNKAILFFQDVLEDACEWSKGNLDQQELETKIKNNVRCIYHTFPGTSASRDNHYFSRFLLGQLSLLNDVDDLETTFEKYVFLHEAESVPVSQFTRSKKTEDKGIISPSTGVTTMVLIPKSNENLVCVINVIEADGRSGILSKKVPLDKLNKEIGERKIVELNFNFNIEEKLDFEKYFNMSVNESVSLDNYNKEKSSNFQGSFENIPYSGELEKIFEEVIKVQLLGTGECLSLTKQALLLTEKYEKLWEEIGKVVWPFRSLIKSEARTQAVLDGIFNHYSNRVLEKSGNLVLGTTEFQAGSRRLADMVIHGVVRVDGEYQFLFPCAFEFKGPRFTDGKAIEAETLLEEVKGQVLNLKGAAYKVLADGNRRFAMGVVFNSYADNANSLFKTTNVYSFTMRHSSIPSPLRTRVGGKGFPYWMLVEMNVPYWVFIQRSQVEGLGLRDSCIILESDQDVKQYLERPTTGSKTLDLFNTCLNNSLIETLVEFLSTQEVNVLDLSFNELESEGVKNLIDALVNSKRTVSFLNLSDNAIGSNGSESGAISSLAKLIENNNVICLAISDVAITSNDFSKIFYALKKNTSIEKLDLSQNKIKGGFNEEIVGVMADVLYHHPTLTVLDLSNTGITDNTVKSIVEKAKKDCAEKMQPNIKNLYIREGKITEKGMESLVKFVTQAKKLESLSLSGNPIGIGVERLVTILKDTEISTLELCDVSLKCDESNTESIAGMMVDLINESKVRILDLSYNDLNMETIEKIFSAISSRKEKVLEKLNLSGNEIGDETDDEKQAGLLSAISQSLKDNNILKSLGLADMCIHDNVLGEIVFKLEGSNIRDLDISGNDIGDATIEALSQYLIREDTVLEYLSIADYTDEDKKRPLYKNIKDLFEALEENETLTHLDISCYVLNDSFINAISAYLSSGKANLSYLDLSKSELTKPLTQMETLFSALKKNDKLQHLHLLDIEMTDEIADVIIAYRQENKKLKIFISEGQLSSEKKKELGDLSVEVIPPLPDVKKGAKNTQEGKFDEDKVSRRTNELSGSQQFWTMGNVLALL